VREAVQLHAGIQHPVEKRAPQPPAGAEFGIEAEPRLDRVVHSEDWARELAYERDHGLRPSGSRLGMGM
jgi:hypothetical protein